jgi:hypothetical protein
MYMFVYSLSLERQMSKYENLIRHFAALDAESWTATFSEIEIILGSLLPQSAYQYPAWWSNQAGEGHSQSRAWQDAGWRTTNLDIANRRVTFLRNQIPYTESARSTDVRRDATKSVAAVPARMTSEGISIPEAKARLAIYFGVSPENIEITIRG